MRTTTWNTCLALCLATGTSAWADCAMGSGYGITVEGNTVSIRLVTNEPRTCPDPGGLLRQATSGGAVVKLADFCAPDGGGYGAYVDECVPPGSYRYGLAQPYTCGAYSCGGTPYYETAVVTAPLDAGCVRSAGNPGPTAVSSQPWGDSSLVCGGKSCGCGASGSVLVVDGLVAAAGLAFLRRRRSTR